MHVVEFGDCRVSRLQHLDIGLRGDRLERVGIDAVEECVHRLPPRPEAVAVRARVSRCVRRSRAGRRANGDWASPARAGRPRARRLGASHRASTRAIVPSAAMSIATSRCQPSWRQRVGGEEPHRAIDADDERHCVGGERPDDDRRGVAAGCGRGDEQRMTLVQPMRGACPATSALVRPFRRVRERGTARARIASPHRARRRRVLARGRAGTSR